MLERTFSKSVYRGGAARSFYFAILAGLTLLAFGVPLTTLVRFSFQHEHYSHIILIPLVSASLMILERKRIFSHAEIHWCGGLGLLVAGALFYSIGRRYSVLMSENDQLSISIVSVVL